MSSKKKKVVKLISKDGFDKTPPRNLKNKPGTEELEEAWQADKSTGTQTTPK